LGHKKFFRRTQKFMTGVEKSMKKVFAIILSLLFLMTISFAVVGCKKAEEQKPAEPPKAQAPALTPAPAPAPAKAQAPGKPAAPEAPGMVEGADP
jgi:preprotein translocase subunit SecG